MELKVIPWYADGLRFTCTQCGNCCTGAPGVVWISKREIQRLAEHLKLTTAQVIEKYCRTVGQKYSLKENRNSNGEYDCIFLKEEKVTQNGITLTRRGCTVYQARPLQCRTWPFWDSNLRSKEMWDRSAQHCHGMNHGSRIFSKEEIEALRDAKDWPERPPTSE